MRAPDLGPVTWRKSSRTTGNDNCVEIADLTDGTAIRDSKDPNGNTFIFAAKQWSAFLAIVKTGKLDH